MANRRSEPCVRAHVRVLDHARTKHVGKYQSCMVSNLPIIWKQTVVGSPDRSRLSVCTVAGRLSQPTQGPATKDGTVSIWAGRLTSELARYLCTGSFDWRWSVYIAGAGRQRDAVPSPHTVFLEFVYMSHWAFTYLIYCAQLHGFDVVL